MSDADEIPSVFDDVSNNYLTIYMGFASFTMLMWEHAITFSDEVEFIWKGKKGPLVYLFFLNRYLIPLGFIVNLFAYLSNVWTPEICSEFVRYEGAMTMIGIEVVALMMLLRIYAMYSTQRWVVAGVVALLVLLTAIMAGLLTRGQAVIHNAQSGVKSCTMIFDPEISVLASASAWGPLLYDTVILVLTLMRTVPAIRHKEAGQIIRALLRDGLLYYSVIFSVTLCLTIMILVAPPGLKNVTAQLELLLTVAMMSRITLNLKKTGRAILDGNDPDKSTPMQPPVPPGLVFALFGEPTTPIPFPTRRARSNSARNQPFDDSEIPTIRLHAASTSVIDIGRSQVGSEYQDSLRTLEFNVGSGGGKKGGEAMTFSDVESCGPHDEESGHVHGLSEHYEMAPGTRRAGGQTASAPWESHIEEAHATPTSVSPLSPLRRMW